MEKISQPRREHVVSLIWFLFRSGLTAVGKEGDKVVRPVLSRLVCVEDLIFLLYCGLLFILPVQVFEFLSTFLVRFLLYALHHTDIFVDTVLPDLRHFRFLNTV